MSGLSVDTAAASPLAAAAAEYSITSVDSYASSPGFGAMASPVGTAPASAPRGILKTAASQAAMRAAAQRQLVASRELDIVLKVLVLGGPGSVSSIV